MSDPTDITDDKDEEFVQPDELTSLKAKADLMGIRYHPSIGVDKLRAKVLNALSDNPVPDEELDQDDEPETIEQEEEQEEEDEEESTDPTPEELEEEAPVVSSIPKPAALVAEAAPVVKEVPVAAAPVRALTAQEKVNEARAKARDEALRMVRINVTCMNPLKTEWNGELFTIGNNLIGTVSKFVPFGTVDGWHVPNIIYLMIKDRQYQQFTAKKVRPGQPPSRDTKLVREFSIELMDPLSPQELQELKQRQLMARGQE